MATARPEGVDGGAHTLDDGLFGPESVTWRSMAHPSTAIGASAAAMIQMLYPPVMYVVDQTSSFQQKPELRAQRTSDYAATITYGDVATAEAAGGSLRKIHARCTGTHPDTGEPIAADDPQSLVWVHNALTWALLRAWTLYGPQLSPAEQDRFVEEQLISARLVGCDLDTVATNVAELNSYMTSMEPKLAMTAPGRWFKEIMVAPPTEGGPMAKAGKALMTQAMVSVMGSHHRALWGFPWSRVRRRLVVTSGKAMFGSIASKLPIDSTVDQLRQHVDSHAFGSRRNRKVAAIPDPSP